MKVAVNQNDNFEKEVKILLDWAAVGEDYNDLLSRYLQVPVKGFRVGKTPAGLIESMFKNEIKNDLAAACTTRFCRTALKEHGLEAVSPIEITDLVLDKGVSFAFKASFIEMPAFALPDYAHLHLEATTSEAQLNEVSLKLLAQTTINIHLSLIRKELEYSETPLENMTEADRDAAADRVKLMLILKKIASSEGIEVTDKDIDERIHIIAQENELPFEQVKEYFTVNKGVSRLSDSLIAEQVLKYIIDIQK